MLANITLGQYLPGDSSIHRMDPRVKIAVTFLFFVLAFMVHSVLGYGALMAFVLIGALAARLPLRYLIRGLKPLLFIIIFTFVLNLFMSAGDPIVLTLGSHQVPLHWRFIRVTWQGLTLAVTMVLRLLLLIMGTQLLTLTTSPLSLTDGIELLLAPLKRIHLPVHELAMMMTIAMRFIPTLMQETDRIMKAQMSRGADFSSGNLVRRAKSMVPLLVPLFVSAFRRADELAMAMEARGYRGGEGRTRMKQLKMTHLDLVASLVTLLLMATVFADYAMGKGWL